MSKKELESAIASLRPYLGGTDQESFVGQLSSLVEPFDGSPDGVEWKDLAWDANIPLSTRGGPISSLQATQPERQVGRYILDVQRGGTSVKELIDTLDTFLWTQPESNPETDRVDETSVNAARAAETTANRVYGNINFLFEPSAYPEGNHQDIGNNNSDELQDTSPTSLLLETNRVGMIAQAAANPNPSNHNRCAWRELPSRDPGTGPCRIASVRRMLGLPLQKPEQYTSFHRARDQVSGINSSIANPSPENPNLSCILLRNPRLQYCVRDVGSAQVFLNLIDSVTMSKASPYLDIQLISLRNPVNEDANNRYTRSTSLYRFLEGSTPPTIAPQTANLFREAIPPSLRGDLGLGATAAVSSAGMELFTSPQTLVNANEPKYVSSSTRRAARIKDNFRPFATVTKVDFSVTPAGGFITHKTAQLEIVLHDRSRLSEIAELVKPSLYGTTQLLIEYGWAHTDASPASDNVVANFINSLRQKEKYQVVNSSFSFGDAGEVTITVHLSLMPVVDFDNTLITDSRQTQNAHNRIADLLRTLARHRELISPSGGPSSVQGESWINSLSSVRSVMSMNSELITAMVNFRNSLLRAMEAGGVNEETQKARADVIASIDALVVDHDANASDYLGSDGTVTQTGDLTVPSDENNAGALAVLRNNIDNAHQKKFQLLYGMWGSTDPFFKRIYRRHSNRTAVPDPDAAETQNITDIRATNGESTPYTQDRKNSFMLRHILFPSAADYDPNGIGEQPGAGREQFTYRAEGASARANSFGWANRNNSDESEREWIDRDPLYVSLGKLLMMYLGRPIADAGKYDEVQFVFYNFNRYASYVRNFSIAEFPISTRLFQTEMEKRLTTSAVMNVREFLGFINSKFVSDPAAHAWGLNDMYKIDGAMNREFRLENIDASQVQRLREARLADAYTSPAGGADAVADQELRFRPPRLSMDMEVVTMTTRDAEGHVTEQPGKTLLKIHIFDRQATAYESQAELISQSRNDRISAIRAETRAIETSEGNNADSAHVAMLTSAITAGILQPTPSIASPGATAVSEWLRGRGNKYVRLTGGFEGLKTFIKKTMPSVTYGSTNSAIISTTLSSQNDSSLATIQMMRQNQGRSFSSADAVDRGVPITVSPMSLSMETFGFPFFRFTQQIFFDFGTGTTVDNIYAVSGINHTLTPGEFKTSVSLFQIDGFGQYEGMMSQLERAISVVQENSDQQPES